MEYSQGVPWSTRGIMAVQFIADFLACRAKLGIVSNDAQELQNRVIGSGFSIKAKWLDFAAKARDMRRQSQTFQTTSRHIGLGPVEIQPGDQICVLFGARLPFPIRKPDKHWLWVGECFLHGLMNGEAIERWKDGNLQAQTFQFR